MVIISIIVAIIVFGLIIMLHETGHFTVAKLFGVRINEFSIGMGPKIFTRKRGDTAYSIGVLPIGGYVAMEGEDNGSSDPRAFNRKPVRQRFLIVCAGAAMNLLLGFILLTVVTSFSGGVTTTKVAEFYSDDAPSHVSGLEVGDEIVRVNGFRIFCDNDISYQFQIDEDRVFNMRVIRDGMYMDLPEVEFAPGENGEGLMIDFYVVGEKVTPFTVLSYSSRKFASFGRMIWITLIDLLKGKYKINDLSGPVGIVDAIGGVVGETAQGVKVGEMLLNLMTFAAFISINVGIFNLLPIPALDGARALFIIIEGIRRKPLKPEVEGLIHSIGFAALMGLMLVVTFFDILKLIRGE